MDTIKDIWFDANRIYMKTDGGETFSRPLEAFPLLKDASDRYKPQNKMFHFCKTFCSKITLVNTIQNVI